MAAVCILAALVVIGGLVAVVSPDRSPERTAAPALATTTLPSTLPSTTAAPAPTPTSTTTTAPEASPTTAPPPSPGPPPSVLPTLATAEPHPGGYDRDQFRAWIDADDDCQDTRAEVLIAESQVPVQLSVDGCTVVAGQWIDPWSGEVDTQASALDVDHTVPLANAWRSGAYAWDAARREAFANDLTDPDALIAIPAGENRSKSDDGPEAWKPPDPTSWCRYAIVWARIKARWELTATAAEWEVLLARAGTC